jgi:hypothetical protein
MTDKIDNSQEQPEECDCCQFKTEALKPYEVFFASKAVQTTHKWLCELCASTYAGNAYEYPEQYPYQVATLRAMCYIGNVLLKAIQENGKQHDNR